MEILISTILVALAWLNPTGGEIPAPDGHALACNAGYEANDDMTGCQPLAW